MKVSKEDLFKQKFIKPLVDCYGQQKFPEVRVRAIWEKLKGIPEHLYSKAADKVVLNCDLFPGVQKILDTAGEVAYEFSKNESERLKEEIKCSRCRSQGVLVVDNFAYKCTCQLGELLYPAYARYDGQAPFIDKISTGPNGEYIFENGTMHSIVPASCKDIRQIKTVIKRPEFKLIKNDNPINQEFKKTDFSNFLPKDPA